MAINLNKAVFIDKDGTLICDVPYNVDPTKITLQSGAGSTLRRLKEAGYKLIVISNQSGIARGYFPLEALAAVNQRIQELLEPYDVTIDDFYYCPHGPDDGCACRKPQPGLLLRAAEDYLVDMQQSWMIGDILHDIEAGNQAGCRTIHLDVGNETDWHLGAGRHPDHPVHTLKAAADVICRSTRERSHYEKAVSYNH